MNKLNEFRARALEQDADIIGITEILPKNCRYTPTPVELAIPGYECFLNMDGSRGVALYVKCSLQAKIVNIKSDFKESIWVNVPTDREEHLLVGVIYRSPNSNETNNLCLNQIFSNSLAFNKSDILIMGDFNYPTINWCATECSGPPEARNFVESVQDSYLHQHVLNATRARVANNPSVLDLVFTSDENMIDKIQYESPLGHSDHGVLLFTVNCSTVISEPNDVKWNFFKGDYESMKKGLDVDWETLMGDDDINNMWAKFADKIEDLRDKYIPKTKTKAGKNAKKHHFIPIDQKTIRKIKKKHRLWQRFMETRSGEKYQEFAKVRNQVKGMMRKARRNTEQDIAKNAKSNPKKFWQYANSKRKSNSGISDLEYSENEEIKTASTDVDKANVLASFFSSVFTNEPGGNLPEPDPVEVNIPAQEIQITEEMVRKLLLDLDTSKATGPDGMHPYMLKSLAEELKTPLFKIFKYSIEKGKLPDAWKLGSISALHKKGSKANPGNYRPVSLTSIVCKLLEKIIRDKLLEHMRKNDQISEYQFGFLPGRSTTIQLLNVMEDWTRTLDEGGQIDAVYMDFMKAFDKVPHQRLIQKLKNYGFNMQTTRWVQDFLSNRLQEVRVNGAKSNRHEVTSGIPQGSVLGPILFVIYINDMPQSVKSKIYLFADDTKIYTDIKTSQDQTMLQEDLQSLYNWSETWLLKFHPDKCKSVTITRNATDERTYHLFDENGNTVELEKTQGEKDIGVLIDSKLNFRSHIQAQVNKANSIMGLIRRTYSYLDEESFKLLFKALVRPHIEYAAAVWNPYHKQDVELLENVQRRATRQLSSIRDLSYPERLKTLNLPTLKYRRARGDMIETFKILNNIYDPKITTGLLPLTEETRTRHNTKKLKKNAHRKDIRKYSFTQRVVNIWNSLPSTVVNATSVQSFENRLDNHWRDQTFKFDWEADINTDSRTGTRKCRTEEEDVDIVVNSQRP